MEGLLGNPVLQGLLDGGGPMGVRAQSQRQLAQMMPRGGGGMIGAPSAPAPDRSGAAAIAALGQSAAGAITGIAQKNAAEEAKAQKMQALTAHIDSLDIPEEQKVRYRTLAAGNPDAMFNVLGKQLLGTEPKMERDVNNILRYVGGPNNGQQVFDGVTPTAKPLTALAQSKADLEAGLITPEQHEAVVRKATYIAPTGGGNSDTFGTGATGRALALYSQVGMIPEGQRTPQQQADFLSAQWLLTQTKTEYDPTGRPYQVTPSSLPALSQQPPANNDPQTSGATVTAQAPTTQQPQRRAPDEATTARALELRDTIDQSENTISQIQQALNLNQEAYAGVTADLFVKGARATGVDDKGLTATTKMKNIIMEQVLPQLKQIFGGNPTEGERQVLLEMQASITMRREERAALLERAIRMARKRLSSATADLGALGTADVLEPRPGPAAPQGDYAGMSFEDLLNVDVMRLTPSEASAYQDALKKAMDAQ